MIIRNQFEPEVKLFKGGSTQDTNNYRPISLLSIFDKIIKKLMHKMLSPFLRIIIYYLNQYGFRKNNSTVYVLVQTTELITATIDRGKFGCGIFIDLKGNSWGKKTEFCFLSHHIEKQNHEEQKNGGRADEFYCDVIHPKKTVCLYITI